MTKPRFIFPCLFPSLVLCLVLGACGSSPPASTAQDTQQDSQQVTLYPAIQYARAERFKAPEVLQPAPQKLTTGFPPICPQGDGNTHWYQQVAGAFNQRPEVIPALPESIEECLFLNIWTPAKASNETPVMVWIHGGSNKNGYSYEPNYLAHNIAAQGVVVVSIAYRLGVFGFFAHPTNEGAGNFGLLDQIAALEWIKSNIAAYGGNPNNVTLFGESAGAADIGYLMAAPAAQGLFHRAISQSGGWNVQRTTTLDSQAAKAQKLIELAGGPDALETLPVADLLKLADEVYTNHYWDPVIDGKILPRAIPKLMRDGEFQSVPLLVGFNRDENLMYQPARVTEQDFDRLLQQASVSVGLKNAKSLITFLDSKPLRERVNLLGTALSYACPSMQWAAANHSAGARSWVYEFRQRRGGSHGLGVYHGAEIPYVFNTHDHWLPTNADDRALTDLVMSYWLNFARAGNPNGAGLPNWPHAEPDQMTVQPLSARLSLTIPEYATRTSASSAHQLCEVDWL